MGSANILARQAKNGSAGPMLGMPYGSASPTARHTDTLTDRSFGRPMHGQANRSAGPMARHANSPAGKRALQAKCLCRINGSAGQWPGRLTGSNDGSGGPMARHAKWLGRPNGSAGHSARHTQWLRWANGLPPSMARHTQWICRPNGSAHKRPATPAARQAKKLGMQNGSPGHLLCMPMARQANCSACLMALQAQWPARPNGAAGPVAKQAPWLGKPRALQPNNSANPMARQDQMARQTNGSAGRWLGTLMAWHARARHAKGSAQQWLGMLCPGRPHGLAGPMARQAPWIGRPLARPGSRKCRQNQTRNFPKTTNSMFDIFLR